MARCVLLSGVRGEGACVLSRASSIFEIPLKGFEPYPKNEKGSQGGSDVAAAGFPEL